MKTSRDEITWRRIDAENMRDDNRTFPADEYEMKERNHKNNRRSTALPRAKPLVHSKEKANPTIATAFYLSLVWFTNTHT